MSYRFPFDSEGKNNRIAVFCFFGELGVFKINIDDAIVLFSV